jgi:putative glycosyltransferase (TIGR04372 family)
LNSEIDKKIISDRTIEVISNIDKFSLCMAKYGSENDLSSKNYLLSNYLYEVNDFIAYLKTNDLYFNNLDIFRKSLAKIKLNNAKRFILDEVFFTSIGHFYFLESLIKGMILKKIQCERITFKIAPDKIANLYLVNKYKEILIDHNLWLDKFNKAHMSSVGVLGIDYWPTPEGLESSLHLSETIQKEWAEKGNGNLIVLSQDEELERIALLSSLGVVKDKKIITFHLRQSGFNDNLLSNAGLRNSSPINFYKAIKKNCEYNFLMLGHSRMKPVKHENIISYPHTKFLSSKNDFYLLTSGIAHIGTHSGISLLALSYKQPILFLNTTFFLEMPKNDISIFLPRVFIQNQLDRISSEKLTSITPPMLNTGILAMNLMSLKLEESSVSRHIYALSKFIEYIENKKLISDISFLHNLQFGNYKVTPKYSCFINILKA